MKLAFCSNTKDSQLQNWHRKSAHNEMTRKKNIEEQKKNIEENKNSEKKKKQRNEKKHRRDKKTTKERTEWKYALSINKYTYVFNKLRILYWYGSCEYYAKQRIIKQQTTNQSTNERQKK